MDLSSWNSPIWLLLVTLRTKMSRVSVFLMKFAMECALKNQEWHCDKQGNGRNNTKYQLGAETSALAINLTILNSWNFPNIFQRFLATHFVSSQLRWRLKTNFPLDLTSLLSCPYELDDEQYCCLFVAIASPALSSQVLTALITSNEYNSASS